MKGEMERRVVYGSDDFMEKMQEKYKIEGVIRPKRRPKKSEDDE